MSDTAADIVRVAPVDPDAELDRLAQCYAAAGGRAVRLLNLAGAQAESLIDRLPVAVRSALTGATEQALIGAMRAATSSRRVVPDQAPWVKTALATGLGAAGGAGGMPTALAELPVTTTLLLRSIQDVARQQGFDPLADNVTFDCIRVLSAAGPLTHDDGADLGFFGVRLTLSGGALQKMVSAVAPRLAQSLGQKLAVQSVPVLGALAGATTNYVYAGYYQNIAQVHFGLRRLMIDADLPEDVLLTRLRARLAHTP
ncbi:MAG: EcsC family protein [Marinibacterium sp.]